MSTPVQDTFDVETLADDESLPIKRDTREAVRLAVNAAAREHGGRVTAATIRPHLPKWCNPQQIGPTILRLERRGYLVRTGHYDRNGKNDNRAKNGAKRSPVYRVAEIPVPVDAVEPGRTRRRRSAA